MDEGLLAAAAAPVATAQEQSVIIEVHETIGVQDAVGVLPPAAVSLTESIGVQDVPRVLPPAVVPLTQSISVQDTIRVLPPAVVPLTESIGVQDTVRALPSAVIPAILEIIGLTESLRVLPPAAVPIQESVTVSEAPSLQNISFAPAVSSAVRRFLYARRAWTLVVATFTDEDTEDTHTATIAWGDGTMTNGSVDEEAGIVRGTHRYTTPGTYTVHVVVVDSHGARGASKFHIVVRPHPRLRIAGILTGM